MDEKHLTWHEAATLLKPFAKRYAEQNYDKLIYHALDDDDFEGMGIIGDDFYQWVNKGTHKGQFDHMGISGFLQASYDEIIRQVLKIKENKD